MIDRSSILASDISKSRCFVEEVDCESIREFAAIIPHRQTSLSEVKKKNRSLLGLDQVNPRCSLQPRVNKNDYENANFDLSSSKKTPIKPFMRNRPVKSTGFGGSIYEDDDFSQLLRLGMSKTSTMMIRKDRHGIAIQKGQKQHKITFRDEVSVQVSQKANFAPRATPSTFSNLAPKQLSAEMENFYTEREVVA